MAEKTPNISDLSPQVEASIIKVAGEWAIFLTDKTHLSVKLKPTDQVELSQLLTTLQENFQHSRNRLMDSVRQE